MNKSVIGIAVLIVLAIGGGYYLWSTDTTDPMPPIPVDDTQVEN